MAKKVVKNNISSQDSLMLMAAAVALMAIVFSFMFSNTGKPSKPTPKPITDEQGIKFLNQGTSDEIDDIEKDIKATDYSKLDLELPKIEQELSE